MAAEGVFVSAGTNYAIEPLRALGLSDTDGVVRIGFVHYHTPEDVDCTVEALARVAEEGRRDPLAERSPPRPGRRSMLVRTLAEVIGTPHDVDWTNGTSRRVLVAADGRGFAVTETYVRPGTASRIRFANHFEACYCVEGSGRVETAGGAWEIAPGTIYAPDREEQPA